MHLQVDEGICGTFVGLTCPVIQAKLSVHSLLKLWYHLAPLSEDDKSHHSKNTLDSSMLPFH